MTSNPRPVSRVYFDSLVEAYAGEAMKHARTRQLGDGRWLADVAGLDGAWSDGDSPGVALSALPAIIIDWATLKVMDLDGDIPAFKDIDLNRVRLAKASQ